MQATRMVSPRWIKPCVLLLSRSLINTKALRSALYVGGSLDQRARLPSPSRQESLHTSRKASTSQRFSSISRTLLALGPAASPTSSSLAEISNDTSAHDTSENDVLAVRRDFLNAHLARRNIDAAQLEASLLQSAEDPSSGYDDRFGKSALKSYRSFVHPTSKEDRRDETVRPARQSPSLESAARSRAQQIDFLIQRHHAHRTEWVRNRDASRPGAALAKAADRTTFPIVLVLDNVRSAFNVGSLFRTADATGCESVVTVGVTPHPSGSGKEKLRKTGLGAEALVPSLHFETIYEALDHLTTSSHFAGYEIVALETTDRSVLYSEHSFGKERGVIIVLGNEVTGVPPEVLSTKVDQVLEIPMFGAKNSLNVAACAPIVLFEILRQWGAGRHRVDEF